MYNGQSMHPILDRGNLFSKALRLWTLATSTTLTLDALTLTMLSNAGIANREVKTFFHDAAMESAY